MQRPDRVEVGGLPLRCAHCGHDVFQRRGGNLGALYVDTLFAASQPVVTYACERCGHVHWFAAGAEHRSVSEAITCLQCGTAMGADDECCASCGWSYVDLSPPPHEPEREDPEPASITEEEEAPEDDVLDAGTVCPHCGAERGERSTICGACGQIFER